MLIGALARERAILRAPKEDSMGELKKALPPTVGELKTYLQKLSDNQKHLKGVKVNPGNSRIEIALSFAANMAGYPDSFIPLKKANLTEAKDLVDRLMSGIKAGSSPSDADVLALFEMIDQQGG
jgi:hypothetical protein